jgi:hypothetical protein
MSTNIFGFFWIDTSTNAADVYDGVSNRNQKTGFRRWQAVAFTRVADRASRGAFRVRTSSMSLGTLLLIILIVMLMGGLPTWGHSRNWGYGPSGGIGMVLIIVLILVLMGRL